MEQADVNDSVNKAGVAFREMTPQKGLYLLGFLGITFVVLSVFHVWLYVQQVQFNYRLSRLYQQHELLLETQRKLRLEWARFEDPYLLEELGREKFGLAPAAGGRKFILQDGAKP